ncbi:hypothetical protein JD844_013658, partial [Phrynosoma platyrhinos]
MPLPERKSQPGVERSLKIFFLVFVGDLAISIPKPEVISRLERGEEPCIPNPQTTEGKKISINLCEGNELSLISPSIPASEVIVREIKEEIPETDISDQVEPRWTLLAAPPGSTPLNSEMRCDDSVRSSAAEADPQHEGSGLVKKHEGVIRDNIGTEHMEANPRQKSLEVEELDVLTASSNGKMPLKARVISDNGHKSFERLRKE